MTFTRLLSSGQNRNKTGSHQGFKITNLNHKTTSGLFCTGKKLIQPMITNVCTAKGEQWSTSTVFQQYQYNSEQRKLTQAMNETVEKEKMHVNHQLQYLRSMCTGLTSQSSWLLGLAGAVSSWKFSKVDIMSWTCRFSSLISCHNWDTDRNQKIPDTLLLPSV